MTCASDPQAPPTVERAAVARKLTRMLDEVVFNVEHGLPWKLVNDLEEMAEYLKTLTAADGELRDDTARFTDALGRLFVDQDAVEQLLVLGGRIASRLEAPRSPNRTGGER